MPKNINLVGTSGKEYNLDKLQAQQRTSTDKLNVEVWYWNPGIEGDHGKPNPPKNELTIGRIWLSNLVSIEEFNKIMQAAGE